MLVEARTEPHERHAEDDSDVALLLWLLRELELYEAEPAPQDPSQTRRRRGLRAAARAVAARVDEDDL